MHEQTIKTSVSNQYADKWLFCIKDLPLCWWNETDIRIITDQELYPGISTALTQFPASNVTHAASRYKNTTDVVTLVQQ